MVSNYLVVEAGFHVHAIRGLLGAFHLLHDAERRKAVLIDTGLWGEVPQLGRVLAQLQLRWHDIEAILLTHGHLDHTGNLARIKDLTGAPIWAHPLDQMHIAGTYPYRGPSRICGAMEAVGRGLFRHRAVPSDHPLQDGLELPFWGGLRVLHLPGHTDGHCGFYSPRFDLLFSGDLFASYGFSVHPPPVFLNSHPEHLGPSLERVRGLNPARIVPNHYDSMDGALHRMRLGAWLERRTASAFGVTSP